MRGSINTVAGAVLGAAFAALAPPAMGGDAAATDNAIEEVIVTARKREESLSDIPESVVALPGAAIDRRNLLGLEDIGFQVPSLNLSTRLDGFPNVSIRGVGSFGNTQGVGFYLDDVQVFSDASSRFGDLERIEVLKGPQGTLYGGSNIGGAVKFVSARPDSEEQFGRVKLRAGDGIVDGEGSLNAPLGDNGWAVRLFGFSISDDGYLTNPNSTRANGLRNSNDSDVGASEEYGLRVSLSGPLGEGVSAYGSIRVNGYDGPNNTWIRELDDRLEHPNVVDTTTNPRHERTTVAAMGEITWEREGFDIVSVTSYTDTDSERYTDLDIRQEYLLDLIRPEIMEVFTQEVRIISTDAGPLQWLAGGYYSRFNEEMDSDLIWFDTLAVGDGFTGPLGCAAELPTCSGVWAGNPPTASEEQNTVRTPFEKRYRDKSHLAAFANATYNSGDWEFGGGLRVDRWNNESENFDTGITGDQSGVEVLPRLSVTRRLGEGSIVYASASRGYEPGGFNLTNFAGESELLGFDPEEATSVELGWKGRFADGRMSASLAAFSISYRSRQVEYQATDADGAVIEGIVNVGDSEQTGVEATAEYRASDALRLSFAIGTVNAEWESGTVVADVDLGGTKPPVVPELSWNLGADFQRAVGGRGLEVLAGIHVSHNGEYEGLQAWDPVRNPAYRLVEGYVGVASDRWEATVNVENLADKSYYTDVQRFPNFYLLDGGDNIVIGTLGRPMTVTASVSYTF